MAARRRIPKKKLKQPDEFITWGSRAMNYAIAHMRYIVLGALLVGGIILALFLWRQHVTASEDRAFTLLGKGLNLFQQEEKRGGALQAFTELIQNHPRTKAGKIALLYRGRCYVFQKDYELARADFELFLKRSSDTFMRALAFNALGNIYRTTGDYQRAVENFQQVLASEEEWLKPYVLVSMGMCWEKLGEFLKASDAYQKALELSPTAPWGNWATLKVKELKGKVNPSPTKQP